MSRSTSSSSRSLHHQREPINRQAASPFEDTVVDVDNGQQLQTVQFGIYNAVAAADQTTERRPLPMSSDVDTNVLSATERTQQPIYWRPSTSALSPPPMFPTTNSAFDSWQLRSAQHQQEADRDEVTAMDESLRFLDSYSQVRRQGYGREHVLPIYDQAAAAQRTPSTTRSPRYRQQPINSFGSSYADSNNGKYKLK